MSTFGTSPSTDIAIVNNTVIEFLRKYFSKMLRLARKVVVVVVVVVVGNIDGYLKPQINELMNRFYGVERENVVYE